MVSPKENELVEALYDAALGRQSWEASGRQIIAALGGKTVMLSTHDPCHLVADVVLTLGLSEQDVQDYAHFAPHDVWARGALDRALYSKALTSPEVVEDRTLLQSYIYNEYLRRLDIRHLVGALMPLHGGGHVVLGIHREHKASDFTPDETAVLDRLLPHLQRALEVRQRLHSVEQQKASAYDALDRLTLGVILVGATGRLLHVNAAGEAMLRGGDGLTWTPDGLHADSRDDDRRLQELLAGVRRGDLRSAGGHLRVRRRSGRTAYAVMVTPVAPGLVAAGKELPAVLVFVSDPGARIIADASELSALFGFTPAEGRLVLALLNGLPLPDAARQIGISYNTARTQLARAMARTGSRSQLELVLAVQRALGGVARPAVGGPAARE
jgi:DNA-binding CsgD family transcriptional regulator/PAS domain-containing protein